MTHTNSTPANPTPPGWPDPLESPQAEAIRNGKLDDTEIRNLFDCMERELRLHRERAANPAREVSARHPLEVYADSYAEMARMGDGKVDCRSVEVDIRQNMIPVTAAIGAGGQAVALPTREEARQAARLLLRCNGADLSEWGGDDLHDDSAQDALKELSR
jgi:hypothetical protein